MGRMTGSASADISAPIERCFEIAADVDHIAEWQSAVVGVEVIERDDQGRVLLAAITNDAKIRTVTVQVRFRYDAPRGLSWTLVKGDVKSLDGSWAFKENADGTVNATYNLELDPGRMLGMLARGPVIDRVREILVSKRPNELKHQAEA